MTLRTASVAGDTDRTCPLMGWLKLCPNDICCREAGYANSIMGWYGLVKELTEQQNAGGRPTIQSRQRVGFN